MVTPVKQLPARSRAIREKLVQTQERILEAVGNQKLEKQKGNQLEQNQRIIASAAKVAIDILGIGGAETDAAIDVGMMESFSDADVIDVQPVAITEGSEEVSKSGE